MNISIRKSKGWFADNWRMVVVGVFTALVLVLTLYSIYYSATQPKEGFVVRKDYYPESTYTTYKTVYREGENIRIPVQEYSPAKYQITIKGINSKGEEAFGYYEVTPAEYENIKIGDYYIRQQG